MNNKEQLQDRRNKAYDMRLKGMTFRQIGAAMGVSHVTAQKWIKDYLAEVTLPLVDEVRKQEVDRLTRYLEALDARIDDGDDKAIALAIKVSERLCKMLGADMPQQIQVEKTEVTQVDLALRDLIASQAARNAQRIAEAASRRAGDMDSDSTSNQDMLDSDVESIVRDM